MKDEQLRELLRDRSPAPDFDRLVSLRPRRAHVRPAIPLASAAAAALVLVFTLSHPGETPPAAPTAGLLDPVVSPVMRGPDLLEGDRIAARVIAIRTAEANP